MTYLVNAAARADVDIFNQREVLTSIQDPLIYRTVRNSTGIRVADGFRHSIRLLGEFGTRAAFAVC